MQLQSGSINKGRRLLNSRSEISVWTFLLIFFLFLEFSNFYILQNSINLNNPRYFGFFRAFRIYAFYYIIPTISRRIFFSYREFSISILDKNLTIYIILQILNFPREDIVVGYFRGTNRYVVLIREPFIQPSANTVTNWNYVTKCSDFFVLYWNMNLCVLNSIMKLYELMNSSILVEKSIY